MEQGKAGKPAFRTLGFCPQLWKMTRVLWVRAEGLVIRTPVFSCSSGSGADYGSEQGVLEFLPLSRGLTAGPD